MKGEHQSPTHLASGCSSRFWFVLMTLAWGCFSVSRTFVSVCCARQVLFQPFNPEVCLCSVQQYCRLFSKYWQPFMDFLSLSSSSFLWDDYTVEVRINDYLDIICPHYTRGEIPSQEAERYVLYMVELEDYENCKPQSFDQLRWDAPGLSLLTLQRSSLRISALHSLHSGQRVPPGRELLLYLWVSTSVTQNSV